MMFFQFMGKDYRKSDLPCNRQSDLFLHDNCDMETFGERLKRRRKKKGLKQYQLARAAKVSQTTISDIERGRNEGSTELAGLAKALGCRPEWLADGELPEEEELHDRYTGLTAFERMVLEKLHGLDAEYQQQALKKIDETHDLQEYHRIQRTTPTSNNSGPDTSAA